MLSDSPHFGFSSDMQILLVDWCSMDALEEWLPHLPILSMAEQLLEQARVGV